MAKEAFIEKRFAADTLAVIDRANEIIAQYMADNYTLTLRQLYYRFVAADEIPNTIQSYKRLGSIINDARMAGLIDWDAIEDRTRSLRSFRTFRSTAHAIRSSANGFMLDVWVGQPRRVEVWVEKEALVEVVERAADAWNVPTFPCRGYVSQSAMYRAHGRFQRYLSDDQPGVLIHLGDHDPSGVDMTRDNSSRLNELFGGLVEVRRIALNMDQIDEYGPPPNPAKLSDSRCAGYIEEYGSESWELDALEPRVLDELVQDAIAEYVDSDTLEARRLDMEDQRSALLAVARRWDEVQEILAEEPDE